MKSRQVFLSLKKEGMKHRRKIRRKEGREEGWKEEKIHSG